MRFAPLKQTKLIGYLHNNERKRHVSASRKRRRNVGRQCKLIYRLSSINKSN